MTSRRSPAAVYAQLAPAVLGYFRSHRCADPEASTGDVFVAVTERLPGFRGDDAALRRWVFTIAHHKLVDEVRLRTRRPEILTDTTADAAVEDPAPFDPELVAALDQLTADQREVLVLRYVADLAIADVARITGRRAGAVKMLQSRGLESLLRDLSGRRDDHQGDGPRRPDRTAAGTGRSAGASDDP